MTARTAASSPHFSSGGPNMFHQRVVHSGRDGPKPTLQAGYGWWVTASKVPP
jgi:hypothetical protein